MQSGSATERMIASSRWVPTRATVWPVSPVTKAIADPHHASAKDDDLSHLAPPSPAACTEVLQSIFRLIRSGIYGCWLELVDFRARLGEGWSMVDSFRRSGNSGVQQRPG